MSVTIVSDTHITALVAFALGENWDAPEQRAEAQRIADCLKSMNVDAYNEVNMDEPGIDEPPCVLVAGQSVPKPLQALKLIEFYESHASEFGGYYYNTAAYEIRSMRAQAIAQLDGYAAAPFTL
jgi:hypothetical protein